MKNKKLAIFAALGVLSVGGISLGIISSEGGLMSNVEANETGSCSLIWNKDNAPVIENNEATSSTSHVALSYSKAENVSNAHVRLKEGGKMRTTDEAYNPVTGIGGFCNGITSIAVTFNMPEVDTSDITQELELKVTFGNSVSHVYSTSYDSENLLTSGEKITFDDAPRSFQLTYSVSCFDYNADLSSYVCDIISTSVNCTMVEEHSLKFSTTYPINKNNFSFYKADSTLLARGEKLIFPEKTRLAKGDYIALQPNNDYQKTIAEEDLSITGGEIVKFAKLNDEVQPTAFIKVNGDLIINVLSDRDLPLYEGRNFVGTYSLYNLNDNLAPLSLELTNTGHLLVGNEDHVYSADENDHITVSDNTYHFFEYGDVIIIKKNSNPYPRYIGSLGNTTITNIAGTGANRILDINNRIAYVNYDKLAIQNYKNTTVSTETELAGQVYNYGGIYTTFKAPIENGKSALSEFSPADGLATFNGYHYLQLQSTSQTQFKPIKQSGEHGTYKSSDGTLTIVIDGYGYATVNGGEPLTATGYKNSTKLITIGDSQYELDVNNKVCELPFVDPIKAGPARVYSAQVGNKEIKVTLEKGKIKVSCESYSAKEYKLTRDYTLTVTFYADYSYDEASYSFKLSQDLTTLTATKDCTSTSSNGDNVQVAIPKDTVLTLVA